MWKQDRRSEIDRSNLPDPLSHRLRFEVEQTLHSLYAEADLADQIDSLYLPFANWLSSKLGNNEGPLILGLSGPQGCGKTTFANVVSRILIKGFELNAVVISLDDLYSSRQDRLKFAEQYSPLFKVRGVPGTHDVNLAISLFERAKQLKDGEVMKFPRFDKSLDDRKAVHLWQEVQGPIDVILFEGWCVGSPVMKQDLSAPINGLEQEKDADGVWRSKVNDLLADDYHTLFNMIDLMVWMQAPNYDVIYEWRNKQERLLEAHLYDIHGGVLDTLDLKVMSAEELKGFMQYYERLTRHLLSVMPERVDVLMRLDESQSVLEVKYPTEH
ncbi:hypothetical protein [Marinomonas sp. THO17]|uniref:hypothetical protein n=1 Tax=Marinomonas sp. THO17 TaxID=3149048 RepID=UPI00336BCBA5